MLPDEFEKLLDSCFLWEGQIVQMGGVIQEFLYWNYGSPSLARIIAFTRL
jgi:hypothetical protein